VTTLAAIETLYITVFGLRAGFTGIVGVRIVRIFLVPETLSLLATALVSVPPRTRTKVRNHCSRGCSNIWIFRYSAHLNFLVNKDLGKSRPASV